MAEYWILTVLQQLQHLTCPGYRHFYKETKMILFFNKKVCLQGTTQD